MNRITSYDKKYGPEAGAVIRRLIARIANLASQKARRDGKG